jgi:penicillin-binding protein 2
MRYRKGDGERSSLFTRRALLLGGAQAVLLSALAGRLYQLQVIETRRFATLAEENRINLRLLAPSRGLIFDRTGQPLAINRNNFRAMATSDRGRGVEVLVDRLDQLLILGEAEKARLLRELRRSRNAQPVVVRENLAWEEVARLEFNAPDLPGAFIDLGQTRDYPEGEMVSHIIGYTGRVADEDLAGRDDPVLQLATLRFGKKGMERSLEDELRGRAGAVQVEVNSVGRVVRELDRTEGQPGSNALLTIDLDLQRFAADRMKEHQSGSVVVLDVVTGDVLAMVSTPGFDPNTFARGITQSEWRDLLESPERPLNNKAINGVYPPGSTYKMVTALAALESKAIDPSTRLPCAGYLELGNIKFHCWLKGGHGSTNVAEAIAASCDCFFYEAARRAGADRIADVGGRLGFGRQSELGLPGEATGIQPSRAWKQ